MHSAPQHPVGIHDCCSASAFSSQTLMPISRYIVVAVVEVLLGLSRLSRAPVELAETEVAVGDEGAHAEFVGQRHRLAVVVLCRLNVGGSLMRRRCRRGGEVPRPR